MSKQANIVFVFGDQWRAQATGYGGDANVATPHLDALARESINCRTAVAGCPVCTPYRASLMTGQDPLTHGLFINDVPLQPRGICLAQAFAAAGYDTAYIGKWHIDGQGRSSYIPPERRLGFDYWKVLECTHDYWNSAYYAHDSERKRVWDGYDAFAQTRDAVSWLQQESRHERPFLLMLSWGPPHSPYHTAPAEYREMYDPRQIELRPNVPPEFAAQAREWLAGYYAHCSALDACVGDLSTALTKCGLAENTIFVFTSDHGDMLGSQGEANKQRPWDESIRVPFLLRYPAMAGWRPRELHTPVDAPDIMPTLLGLCDLPIPDGVEGIDYSGLFRGGADPSDGAARLLCAQPFGQWQRGRHHGREYRGLRTERYTYVRDLDGPWLCYDNADDPYQLRNLVGDCACKGLLDDLDDWLRRKLRAAGDDFLPGTDYLNVWGYVTDETGTVSYTE